MDGRRLADIRAGTREEPKKGGTGYLVGRHLLLTARHVVVDHEREWPRIDVWLGHPGEEPRRRIEAKVVWQDATLDAALLSITAKVSTDGPPVRWGCFIGSAPITFTALAFPGFTNYEAVRGVEQLNGRLSPLAIGAGGGYVLDQAAAPRATVPGAWAGASGAAVFCDGLLVGMIATSNQLFGNRRLHAMRARSLLSDREFSRLISEDTGIVPVAEPVELKDFLQASVVRHMTRTPGSLLAASAETVHFIGRAGLLDDLASWQDSDLPFAISLITGEAGQGKTRLAREFISRSHSRGWVAGFAAIRRFGASADNRESKTDWARNLANQLLSSTRKILIVIDYAETRSDEIAVVVDKFFSNPPQSAVRLLLLSRAAGAWWRNISELLDGGNAQLIALEPLTTADQERTNAYRFAVTGLASHLERLPESYINKQGGQSWIELGKWLVENPPDLSDARLGNALTLQITALLDLLTLGSGQRSRQLGKPEETELLRHERDYLHQVAVKRRLFEKGIISDLVDEDDRILMARAALDRVLAGIILLGPSNVGKAEAIATLAGTLRVRDVTNWLISLYPPPNNTLEVNTVQPDRLAELLLGDILSHQTGLLDQVASLSSDIEDARTMLFVLARTAAYPEFSALDGQIADLIAARPIPFAEIAAELAATIQQSAPLRNGLLHLGRNKPEAFMKHVVVLVDRLPAVSLSRDSFSASITEMLVAIFRTLTEDKPDLYIYALATALNNLAIRLDSVGRYSDSLNSAREAVAIYRRLAQDNSPEGRAALAGSLGTLGIALSRVGETRDALAFSQESANIFQELAQTHPRMYMPRFVLSLVNLASDLKNVGQFEEAVTTSNLAINTLRPLANMNPSAYLRNFAGSLITHSNTLSEMGQWQHSLVAAEEAVNIFRSLSDSEPDSYRVNYAEALSGYSAKLLNVGRWPDSLAASEEAASIYRNLAANESDPYKSNLFRARLADSLNILECAQAETGRQLQAIATAKEVVVICRSLEHENPNAHDSKLAMSLTNLANRLSEAGQEGDALAPAEEAFNFYRRLTRDSPEVHVKNLIKSLTCFAFRLERNDRPDDAISAWESTMSSLSGKPEKWLLEVGYADYLLHQSDQTDGMRHVVSILTTSGIPWMAAANARELVRQRWQLNQDAFQQAWNQVTAIPLPDWLSLTDEIRDAVINWVKCPTVSASRDYFEAHAAELLAPTADLVFEEPAFRVPTDVIEWHRAVRVAVVQYGIAVAYERSPMPPQRES